MQSPAGDPQGKTPDSDERPNKVSLEIGVYWGEKLGAGLARAEERCQASPEQTFGKNPHWLRVLEEGLGHVPYLLVAESGPRCAGYLPLALVQSRLFGRFLVGLPYVNSSGPVADGLHVAEELLARAVVLADELEVRYLELRLEQPSAVPAFGHQMDDKVHMRLELPKSSDELWQRFKPKVRNQVRKGQQQGFDVLWGREELLDDFYHVFSRNMRDLGTPVFGRSLFAAIVKHFPQAAEFCVLRLRNRPVSGALLLHGPRVTEVPSASSLRELSPTNANMLMYWHLMQRAIERGQVAFDFGRSSSDSSTYRFKKQWGAQAFPATWQYYLRKGTIGDMRPENRRYARAIQVWRHLPLWFTRLVGPAIVRGIP